MENKKLSLDDFERLSSEESEKKARELTHLLYPIIEGYTIGQVGRAFEITLKTVKIYQAIGKIHRG